MKTLISIWLATEYSVQMSLINNDCKMSNIYKNSGSFRNVYKYSTIGYSSVYLTGCMVKIISVIGSDSPNKRESIVSHIGIHL